MARDFLLEVGSEEIPARYLPGAIEDLKKRSQKALDEKALGYKSIETYGTPRRLVLFIRDLEEKSQEISQSVRGPSKKVAYNPDNTPSKALLGFARSLGVGPKDVFLEGDYVFGNRVTPGQKARDIMAEVLPQVVMKMDSPHPLRWGDEDWRWFRPIRWVLCLFGEEVVSFEIAGVKSGSESFGHRTLKPEKFCVTSPSDYFLEIKEAYVVLDPKVRRKIISRESEELARKAGGTLAFAPDLLEELVSFSEHPAPFLGEFHEKYLELPEEVLMTSMKYHQKYFPVKGSDHLLPYFVAVRDGDGEESMDNVRKGNQWVLKSRLEDAQFFYNQDLEESLRDRIKSLEDVTFLKDGGTLYQKAKRMEEIAGEISLDIGLSQEDVKLAKEAALLSKCDLLTAMVGEFPELEGIMGGIYAREEGLNPKISKSIYEHYLPKGANQKLPQDGVPSAVALSDKIDTLSLAFALGITVKGSEDPLGLRRQAQGVVSIIVKKSYQLDLVKLLGSVGELVEKDLGKAAPSFQERLFEFMMGRMESYLTDLGYETMISRAVLGSAERRIARYPKMAKAINASISNGKLEDVMAGWRRVSVLGKGSVQDGISPHLLVEQEEKNLYENAVKVRNLGKGFLERGDYESYFDLLSSIKEPIDSCLDKVLIMSEEEDLRENRLALLSMVTGLFKEVAEFKHLTALVS